MPGNCLQTTHATSSTSQNTQANMPAAPTATRVSHILAEAHLKASWDGHSHQQIHSWDSSEHRAPWACSLSLACPHPHKPIGQAGRDALANS